MTAVEHHADEGRLESYAAGDLREPEAEALEEHLLVCPTCQERLAEAESYLRAMTQAARRMRMEPAPAPAVWFRPVWALALLGLALTVVVASQWRGARVPGAPVSVYLEATRGPEAPRIPARKPAAITLAAPELPQGAACRVEIVDERGAEVLRDWTTAQQGRAAFVAARGLAPGRFFIRLYSSTGELLREYGLQVTP